MSKPAVRLSRKAVIDFGWNHSINFNELNAALAESDIPGHATFTINNEGNYIVIAEWKE